MSIKNANGYVVSADREMQIAANVYTAVTHETIDKLHYYSDYMSPAQILKEQLLAYKLDVMRKMKGAAIDAAAADCNCDVLSDDHCDADEISDMIHDTL